MDTSARPSVMRILRALISLYAIGIIVYAGGGGLWLVGRFLGYGICPSTIRAYDICLLSRLDSDASAIYWWCAFAGWPLLVVLAGLLLHTAVGQRCSLTRTSSLMLATLTIALGLTPLGPLRKLPVWPPRLGSREGFERMAGMKLPPGAILLEARGYRGWRQLVQARVMMPRRELLGFVRTSFANSITFPGSEHPRPELKRIKRSQLQHSPYFIYEEWYHPAANDLTVASIITNDGGDNHEALIVIEAGDGGLVNVFLQYVRG